MNLAYVFSFGAGKLAYQAQYLSRSIWEYAEPSEVYAYSTHDEIEQVPDGILDEIREKCNIIIGDLPIEDYPISAKQAALYEASEVTTCDYLLCLDTDTIVLDNIEMSKEYRGDIFVKPVDIGGQYWASEDSFAEWAELCSELGSSFPGFVTKSTVDCQPIPPYWNSGVVLLKNGDIPKQWLSLTKKFYKKYETGYFTDQVALGVLTTKYDIEELDETYNFPSTHRLYVPGQTKILHYNELKHLFRLTSLSVIRKLVEIDMLPSILYYEDFDFQSSVYEYARRFRGRMNHVM